MTENKLSSEIEKIKADFEENNPLGEESDDIIDNLKELKLESNKNPLKAGILYHRCLNFLISLDLSEFKEIEKKVNEFANKKSDKNISEEIRTSWRRFEEDLVICEMEFSRKSFAEERVKKFVSENKKDIYSLISLFFSIFQSE